MNPLIVDHAVKTFGRGEGRVTALADISLEVEPGAFVAIMGASGSGKSTLLHLMAGLTRPDSGRVVIDGQDLSRMNDKQLTLFRRRHIGLIFQQFNLIPTLDAAENIALPLRLDGRLNNGAMQRVDELLERLGLAGRRDHRPDALSGGEQQRVAIGRALVTRPAVILADEPTGNLDSVASRKLCELLRSLNEQEQVTIAMVTHEPSVAAWAKEVALIRDGKLVDRFATEGVEAAGALATRYQQAVG